MRVCSEGTQYCRLLFLVLPLVNRRRYEMAGIVPSHQSKVPLAGPDRPGEPEVFSSSCCSTPIWHPRFHRQL